MVLRSFFFPAEDGIRDGTVTGVQTCALPISTRSVPSGWKLPERSVTSGGRNRVATTSCWTVGLPLETSGPATAAPVTRSEERRVGKGCRSWWVQQQYKKKR